MATLSIIVPIYNSMEYLKNTVCSVLAQSYQDYELLLVNDGSTDNTLKVCQEFAVQDKRIRVLDKKNGGVSSARNYGLMHAQGKYIAFLDSDDCVDAEMYASLINSMEAENADLAGCYIIKEEQYHPIPYQEKEHVVSTKPYEFLLQKDSFMISSLNKVYRRELIGKTRFDENISYSEDRLFVTEILFKAKKMVLLHNYFYHYIQHADSLSWQDTYAVWQGNFQVQQRIYNKIQSLDVTEQLKKAAFEDYSKAIIALLRYDVKYQQQALYEQTLSTYKKVVKQYLKQTKLSIGKRLEYMSYIASWQIASFIHYRLKRRRK